MSELKNYEYTCPQCGEKTNIVLWPSIKTDENPEIKEKLLDGTLFEVECPNCGKSQKVDYPVLYHDKANKVMIYYLLDNSGEQGEETKLEKWFKDLAVDFEQRGYVLRLVKDKNALREKALIFENNLDDRIIEIMKLVYVNELNKTQAEDCKAQYAYFLIGEEKDYLIQFIMSDGSTLTAKCAEGMYDELKRDFAFEVEELSKGCDKIDVEWAMNLIIKHVQQ